VVFLLDGYGYAFGVWMEAFNNVFSLPQGFLLVAGYDV
jgi:hypothetical protein